MNLCFLTLQSITKMRLKIFKSFLIFLKIFGFFKHGHKLHKIAQKRNMQSRLQHPKTDRYEYSRLLKGN